MFNTMTRWMLMGVVAIPAIGLLGGCVHSHRHDVYVERRGPYRAPPPPRRDPYCGPVVERETVIIRDRGYPRGRYGGDRYDRGDYRR